MAWSVLQSNGTNGTAPPSLQYTGNVSSGTVLIAAFGIFNPYSVSAVKDGAGNSFTQIAAIEYDNIANHGQVSLWALATPAGDVGTKPVITPTLAGSGGEFWSMVIQEVSGIQAVADGTVGTSFGVGTGANVSCGAYSSAAASEYLVALYSDDLNVSFTDVNVPAGSTTYTQDPASQNATNNILVLAYGNSAGGAETAAFSFSATNSGNSYGTFLAAFKLAGAASPAAPAVIRTASVPPATLTQIPPQVITAPVPARVLAVTSSARPGAAVPGAAQPGNPGPPPSLPAAAAALVTAPAVPPPAVAAIPPQVITGPLIAAAGTDAAAGADSLAVAVAVSFADAAGAADSPSAAASVPVADAGAAEEYEAPDGMRQDQGGAADALTVTAAVPVADAAGAAEWSYADGSRDDTAAAADALAAAVAVPLTDAGGALDVLSARMTSAAPAVIAGPAPLPAPPPAIAPQVIGGQSPSVPVALADAAAASEWQYADGSRPDAAAGADALTATVAVPLADAAAAADWSYADGSRGDEAGAADALAAAAAAPLPDAGGAADQVTAAVAGAGWADAAGSADAIAVTVTVANTGHVEWLVAPAAARWQVMPGTARWLAAPEPPRWKAELMNFGPVAAISLEYLNMLWTADLAGTEIDPTGQTAGQAQLDVLFAVPQSSGNPLEPAEPQTWFAAAWLTGTNIRGYVAQGLVGPSPALVQLTAGLSFDVWGQIQGTPENPKKFCGTVTAY